jgi:hypothetical protein
VLTVAEAELTDDVCRYLEIFRDYFLHADRFLTELIPELNEYKRYIEMVNNFKTFIIINLIIIITLFVLFVCFISLGLN